MNEKALHTLEYTKILSMLTEFASSPLGKKSCKELQPVSDIMEINRLQDETSAALTHILSRGELSFSGIRDLHGALMRLDMGAALSIQELLDVSSLLRTAARVKNYSRDLSEDILTPMFEQIAPLSNIAREIDRCILSPEEIADDASPTLKHIRRSMKNTGDKIHTQLGAIVNASASMLQENIITMRDGRYCLPVKAEYRNSFSGMLHDQSSTGSTLFMEPAAIVKLNNELREWEIKEQDEITKIIADLSNLAAEESDTIRRNLDVLSSLDFIFARGKLSKQMRASRPVFNTEGYINIKKGRHPLIDRQAVVPIDIHIGDGYDLLVVTGPNTGGKTVSLKTVGLFILMGQSGLHIPAFDQSSLSVYREVYADIGDEQSIEQSLSTFSSHMVNTISIMEKADDHSLVLFDELGAGTDPTEGAALAISILADLHARGATVMATTHYSELKVYALSTEGVENASCEFDVSTLQPTYRLLIGIPGKSNAFAISQKLGLPGYIIEEAKKHLDSEAKSFEDVIADLEASRLALEQEKERLEQERGEAAALKKNWLEKNEKIDKAKDKILKRANEEAHAILSEAKDFADASIRKYNKWNAAGGSNKEMEKQRQDLREKLNKTDSTSDLEKKRRKKKTFQAKDFHIGDTVLVHSMNAEAVVTSLPNTKGDLFIQMGIFKTQSNIKDLEILPPKKETPKTHSGASGSGKIQMSKGAGIKTDVNLIGMTVDEAMPVLDKYLDDAYLAHLAQVTVIHGRGTGALKNAVHSLLKRSSYVKSYRLGEFGEGDGGVTIVEFK